MKVALAQVNCTVGDVRGNARKARSAVERAAGLGADLVLLPELCISGYPPQDLVERTAFLDACEHAVAELASATAGVRCVVGHPARADSPGGRPAVNRASLLGDGRLVATRDKTLLPTYDVFDEARYFAPAPCNTPVEAAGERLGLTICEDVWNDEFFWQRRRYGRDPVEELTAAGARLLVNIAASPFATGKQALRRAMLAATARRHRLPLCYVNMVGGNDQLIFEGRSLAFDASGRVVAEGAAFREDVLLVETGAAGRTPPPPEPEEVDDIREALLLGLRDYARKCGFSRAVVALSGGIDSAVTTVLAAEALGPQNVTALFLPGRYSSERSARDARRLAENIGFGFHSLSIEPLRKCTETTLEPVFAGTEPGVAEENVQARLRGMLVMAYANKFGCLPLATGNKSELAVGYCTLYGDMVGGLAVIGDVPKTKVYRLARRINREGEVIPESVLTRPPSAELKPDQTDQDILPPYPVLDAILELYIEQNREFKEIVAAGHEAETARRVLQMVDRAEFKRRQAPITLRVTRKAFGPGRRLPVAQGWPR